MQRIIKYLNYWMTLTQKEVLDKFQGLDGSYGDGEDDHRFVYIPGIRKDRTVLVAHVDTVFPNVKPILKEKDGIIYSGNRDGEIKYKNPFNVELTRKGMGIGADDRAGAAILWAMRKSGHSLLLVSGEEKGCIGSRWLIENKCWENELNNHSFMLEFDRRGYAEIACYDIVSEDFAKYLKEETNYKLVEGAGTDVRRLCKTVCGANISLGYYSEHTTNERLVVNQWMNTLSMTDKWLSKPLTRFPLEPKNIYRFWQQNITTHQNVHNYAKWEPKPKEETKVRQFIEPISGDIIHCPHCKIKMLQEDWFESNLACPKCGVDF